MANKLNKTNWSIQLKQGLAANINAVATTLQAIIGEPHYTTDTKMLYIFDGTSNLPVGARRAYVVKTANYTLTTIDQIVECTSGTFAITLPTAVGITGQIYDVKSTSTGTITINTTSSQTIDGNASGTMTLVQWDNITFVSDGANWIII